MANISELDHEALQIDASMFIFSYNVIYVKISFIISLPRRSGRSALVAAVVNGHVDVVQLLLFWCAAVDTIDANGRSVLSIAAACGHTDVVRKLLDRGLDEAHRDHMGATPLHLAAAAGHAEVVR